MDTPSENEAQGTSLERSFRGSGLLALHSSPKRMSYQEVLTSNSSNHTADHMTAGTSTVDHAPSSHGGRPSGEGEDETTAKLIAVRVLVVDDNATNTKVLGMQLKKLLTAAQPVPPVVDLAFNGQEAVDLFSQAWAQGYPYAVILMDCQMPIKVCHWGEELHASTAQKAFCVFLRGLSIKMIMLMQDGYEATRDIRALEQRNCYPFSVPIIACTANALEEQQQQALSCGMVGILIKPFKLADLSGTLKLHTSLL